jgi:hypothetical protein
VVSDPGSLITDEPHYILFASRSYRERTRSSSAAPRCCTSVAVQHRATVGAAAPSLPQLSRAPTAPRSSRLPEAARTLRDSLAKTAQHPPGRCSPPSPAATLLPSLLTRLPG